MAYVLPATADFIHHKVVNANDPPSNDCCAICHQRYRTLDEDGTTPENAVGFPCGHEVGSVCFDNWFQASGGLRQLGCFYCHKSVAPARYLQEQVNEIWEMVDQMSPKDIYNELSNTTARGPLSRAIEPLRRYVMVEAPAMPFLTETPTMPLLKDANEDLTPSFEWLLMATSDFLSAVQIYAETSVATNTHRINFEALKRRKCEFNLSYASFQSVIKDMVVKNIDQVKNADQGGRADDAERVSLAAVMLETLVLLVLLVLIVLLVLLYVGLLALLMVWLELQIGTLGLRITILLCLVIFLGINELFRYLFFGIDELFRYLIRYLRH